jgi:hypothetical protein
MILACRHDGLTERINAIVTGLLISSEIGCDFRFMWPDFGGRHESHSVPNEVYEIFSKKFIKKYFTEYSTFKFPVDFDSKNYDSIRDNTVKEYETGVLSALQKEKICSQGFLFSPLRFSECFYSSLDFGFVERLFLDEMFNDEISSFLEGLSSKKKAIDYTALHFRCGDVVHGEARTWGQFARDKSITFPIASYLIESTTENFVVFGASEVDLIELNSQRANVLLAKDIIGGNVSNPVAMILEVLLMSKCTSIIATHGTGVTYLAQLLSGIEVRKVTSLINKSSEYELITKYLNKGAFYNDLQTAFCFYNAFILAWDIANYENILGLIYNASLLDEGTELYLYLLLLTSAYLDDEYFCKKTLMRLNILEINNKMDFSEHCRDYLNRKMNSRVPVIKDMLSKLDSEHLGGFNTYISDLINKNF